MTEIEELIEAARKVLKDWRLPRARNDQPHNQREWQGLLDERIYPAGGARSPTEYIDRAMRPGRKESTKATRGGSI